MNITDADHRATSRGYHLHTIPLGDTYPHAGQPDCWCSPTCVDDTRWIHHARDGRETQERQTGEGCSDGWTNIAEYL